MEEVEFLDQCAVRWPVGVAFESPEPRRSSASTARVFRLVPLKTCRRDNLGTCVMRPGTRSGLTRGRKSGDRSVKRMCQRWRMVPFSRNNGSMSLLAVRLCVRGGNTMSDYASKDHYAFGVLFVDGFREQRPGSAIALLGAALYGWLYRWNSTLDKGPKRRPRSPVVALIRAVTGRWSHRDWPPEQEALPTPEWKRDSLPVLSKVVLSTTEGDGPAHATLSAGLHLSLNPPVN